MKYIFTSGNSRILQDRRTIQSIVGSFLQSHGHSVSMLKIEDHLNYDLRNADLRPRGEVFVLSDGSQVDLSLGAFERSCDVLLTRENYLTLGKILFQTVRHEMVGGPGTELLGIFPAVEKYLRSHIMRLANMKVQSRCGDAAVPDFLIVDVGELLSGSSPSPLKSAVQKFIAPLDSTDLVLMNVDVAEGVPDAEMMHSTTSRILEFYGGVDIKNGVLSFLISEQRGKCCVFKTCFKPEPHKDDILCQAGTLDYAWILEELRGAQLLGMAGDAEPADDTERVKKARTDSDARGTVTIAIIADLDRRHNPYLSVEDTLVHAGRQQGLCVDVRYIYLSADEEDIPLLLGGVEGVVLPGGFGAEMAERKLAFVKCARENDVPFLGICLGFQLAIIEFARNVLGIPDATSQEFDRKAESPIIHKVAIPVSENTTRSICLGASSVECRGEALDIYKKDVAVQRFRHRYMLQNSYNAALEERGMQLVGKTTHDRVVIFKLKDRRFFAGVQYHPELGSTYASIDPIISAFVCEAAAGCERAHE